MKFLAARTVAPLGLVLLGLSSSAPAQNATTNRNVVLRRDPSTSSPALEHLHKGTRLTLVDASADSGFYHVRTEDDEIGWVYSKFIGVSKSGPVRPDGGSGSGPAPGGDTGSATGAAESCDSSLWNHVYHSNRLIVKKQCIAVTGTIVDATADQTVHQPDGVRHEADGDTHGWLRVDPGFENLLNAGNTSAERGNLVFEIICRFPVTQTDAKAACQGYSDRVQLPPVGSHVRIVGSYVQDTFHAQWNEIHPVTSITVIP